MDPIADEEIVARVLAGKMPWAAVTYHCDQVAIVEALAGCGFKPSTIADKLRARRADVLALLGAGQSTAAAA